MGQVVLEETQTSFHYSGGGGHVVKGQGMQLRRICGSDESLEHAMKWREVLHGGGTGHGSGSDE